MQTIKIYRAGLHLGEEAIIEGNLNSGMVNFSGCHLSCHFCYTPETSSEWKGTPYSAEAFGELCYDLVRRGARNLNLISPTHFYHLLERPLESVRQRYGGLLPIVLKISGYESVAMIDAMAKVADVFVPDFKVWDPELARRVGLPSRYGPMAIAALQRMMLSHGVSDWNESGRLSRGILVRHLLMPDRAPIGGPTSGPSGGLVAGIDDSYAIVDQLGNIGYRGLINFMTYFYDPESKKVTNAPPSQLALICRHALSLGMSVLVNGKIDAGYGPASTKSFSTAKPLRGAHGH